MAKLNFRKPNIKFHLKGPNKATFMLFTLGIGIGVLTMAQWKTKPIRITNPVTPYVYLKDSRDNLLTEQEDLKSQVKSLQEAISEKQGFLKKYSTNKKTVEEVEQYKKRFGATELKGRGISIKIDDSKNGLSTVDAITHAADLRDLINFLWSVGAEAISINNERVVFSTSIDCIVNTILINNTKTAPPFAINVIGESKVLERQINNSNNLKDIKKRVKSEGLILEIKINNDLIIPAYNGSLVFNQAQIVE